MPVGKCECTHSYPSANPAAPSLPAGVPSHLRRMDRSTKAADGRLCDALFGIVGAYIVPDRDGRSNVAFREVTRLILALVGSATLCACGDDLPLSAISYAAGAGRRRPER
jgi:hypothetical protein